MYSREEIKALTDKVLNMTKADAVEVDFNGGERSATRWANSTITVNMVQFDQQLTVDRLDGSKPARASTREFDDESLKAMVDEAQEAAQKARDNPNLLPLVKGPQDYMPVDAALPSDGRLRSRRARGRWSSRAVDICEKKGVARLRLHPEDLPDDLPRQLEGAVRLLPVRGGRLHPDVPHARRQRLGLGRHHRRRRTSARSTPRS